METPKSGMKVLIDRDFSKSPHQIRFVEECPVYLRDKVDPVAFKDLIRNINKIFERHMEGQSRKWKELAFALFNLLTFGALNIASHHSFVEAEREIDELLLKENLLLANTPRIKIVSPFATALQHIEVLILTQVQKNS